MQEQNSVDPEEDEIDEENKSNLSSEYPKSQNSTTKDNNKLNQIGKKRMSEILNILESFLIDIETPLVGNSIYMMNFFKKD